MCPWSVSDEGGILTQTTDAPALRLEGIEHRYGSNYVLKNLDFQVRKGEFVALIGPNGAGKSTLIKILDGVLRPSRGSAYVDGQSIADGGSKLVSVVHQDAPLFPTLSIFENLAVSWSPASLMSRYSPFHFDQKVRRSQAALKFVGLRVPLFARAESLSPGQRALLAVGRLLQDNAESRVIVMDEPTASLSSEEGRWLIRRLRELADTGLAVLLVTHRTEDLRAEIDHAEVLIDGRIVRRVTRDEVNSGVVERLFEAHVDAEPSFTEVATDGLREEHERPVARFRSVSTRNVRNVSFDIFRGEVLGLLGDAACLYELAFVAAGVARDYRGHVELEVPNGVGLVPPDRDSQGLFQDRSVLENVVIGALTPNGKKGLIRPREQWERAVDVLNYLSVNPRRPAELVRRLSGGNRQKVLLGRILLQKPSLLVLCEPTSGVDVKTRVEIHSIVRAIAREGAAVLLISGDAQEYEALTNRVIRIADESLSSVLSGDGGPT